MNEYLYDQTSRLVFRTTSAAYHDEYDEITHLHTVTRKVFTSAKRMNYVIILNRHGIIYTSTTPINKQVNELEPMVSFIERDIIYNFRNAILNNIL